MRHLFLLFSTILLLLAGIHASANYADIDTPPLRAAGVLSTNWLAEAKAAIPSAPGALESNFQTITNLLCQESQRGNIAAQGLWGFFVLVQSQSPEEAATGLQLLRNSATNGFVPAMLNMGILYEGGEHLQRDYSEARHWFTMAAEKNNSEGLRHLGRHHHYGLGSARDLAKSVEYYRRAAELTNHAAMKSLGYMLMNGLGVNKDTDEARRWFLRAANEAGNRRAMYNLGVLCFAKDLDTNSKVEAYQWFKQSADLGDALAAFQLASFYRHGWGVVQTNLETYQYWRYRAATWGSTTAQYLMGSAYRTGDGVPKNTSFSIAWYQKSASKKHPAALYDLALHYRADKTNRLSVLLAESYMLQAAQAGHREAQFQCAMSSFRGDVGPPDCEAGKQWLSLSADNGWARAEFCLFQLYRNGTSPTPTCPPYPNDLPQSVKWLSRAAEHEHWQAQAVFAVMLIQGEEVDRNVAAAEKMLRKAAEHGYASAQNDLGFSILNGDTAETDLVEAAMWCRLAQSQATDTNILRRAAVNLSGALSKLNASQRLEVDARVNNFRVTTASDANPMMKDWETNPAYQQEDEFEFR